MEMEDLWKQFVASGKVADYLRFVNGTRTETAEEPVAEDMAGKAAEMIMPGVAEPGGPKRQDRHLLTGDEEAEHGI